MDEALLYVAATLSLIALVLLIVKPLWGLFGIFFIRPLVDATWAQPLIMDFKLTEIVSSLVPLIIFVRMIFDGGRRPFKDMPLKWIWLLYSADTVMFSSIVMFDEDWRAGLSVLMRHLNGLAGFYMVQAYCRDERDFRRFAWALAITGIFPMVTGVMERVTGFHWRLTTGASDVIRNIGLYHDAITIRYFGQQTLLGLLLIFAIGKRSTWVTIFCVLYGLVAVVVIQGAYSKSGLFTLGAWTLLWPLLRKNGKALMGLAGAVAIAIVYYSKEILDSFGFVFEYEVAALQGSAGLDSTFAGRWGMWEDMMKDWEARGLTAHLFGAGHMANGAHNDYLQVLFHGGWIGLGIYVALLCAVGWAIARLLLQRLDIWAITALFAFVMWIVDTIGLVPSVYSGYQWFAWGIIGFCLRHRQDEKLRTRAEIVPAAPSRRFDNLVGAGIGTSG
jgi:O-antigen ligase